MISVERGGISTRIVMTAFSIDRIFIYPVKSLGGMETSLAQISASGSLVGDREWIVTRPDGSLLWQGDIPRMTLLSARLDEADLIVKGHDGSVLRLPREKPGAPVTVPPPASGGPN